MRLHYAPGSPFARIVRVLLRELSLDCEEIELTTFPPPAGYFATNPLGQVPALEIDGGVLFPTRLIVDHLLGLPRVATATIASSVRRRTDDWRDEQVLMVLLALGDTLASMKYQHWAGLGPVGENLIGYDPAERHLERAGRTLDWLEAAASSDGFIPGTIAAQDIALACIILWTEARGGIPWRGRPRLEAIVARLDARPSFAATRPQVWP